MKHTHYILKGNIMSKRAFVSINKNETREEAIVRKAYEIMESKMATYDMSVKVTEQSVPATYLKTRLIAKEREVFGVMFLTNQHTLIAYEELFQGTVNSASIYPREIIKRGLELNAVALVLAHNHPSGINTPSNADIEITKVISEAADLVEMRVLDHFIVAGKEVVSLKALGHM